MTKVLVDNWTIHNSALLITNETCIKPPIIDSKSLYDDMETLIMAILLWDEVYYWNNDSSLVWKNFFHANGLRIPISPLVIDSETKERISHQVDNSVISGGVKNYQLLSNRFQIDYLPEKKREAYLKVHKFDGDLSEISWQKYCVEQVKKGLDDYYESIIGSLGDVKMQFEFPLLLNYIINQAKSFKNCIPVAVELRETAPLLNMRLWLRELHLKIDKGDWKEVKYYLDNVNDIVSSLEKKSTHNAIFTIGMSPAITLDLKLHLLSWSQHVQLTFLRNIVKYGMTRRPLTGKS